MCLKSANKTETILFEDYFFPSVNLKTISQADAKYSKNLVGLS